MGVKPLMGRDLTEKDDVPGAAPVALISERIWKSKFGSSANVLGQQVMVDGISREIIAVLPDDLRYPRLAEIWVPLAETRKEQGVLQRGNHPGFSALGRLKPGVSLTQANADLDTIAVELERLYPDSNATRRVRMDLLLESAVGEYRHSLRLLLGAVGCVLLIACAQRRQSAIGARAFARKRTRRARRAWRESLAVDAANADRKRVARDLRRDRRRAPRDLESGRHPSVKSGARSAFPGDAHRCGRALLHRRRRLGRGNSRRSLAGVAGLEKRRAFRGLA